MAGHCVAGKQSQGKDTKKEEDACNQSAKPRDFKGKQDRTVEGGPKNLEDVRLWVVSGKALG